jgi:hypothetical protein
MGSARRKRWVAVAVMALATGCGGDGPDLPRPTHNPAPVTQSCNVVSDVCLLPYPSSLFLAADAPTPTGHRVAIPESLEFGGFAVEPFNRRDGYPPNTAIVTHFPEGVSAHGLPSPHDRVAAYGASTARDAPIVVAIADITSPRYGERVPYFAEAFESATTPGESLLVITPLAPAPPATRIAVIVTRDVRDQGESRLAPSDTMALLLGDERPEGELGPLWDYYRDLRYLAEVELGIRRRNIVQMWDFHTRSDDGIVEDLLAMREEVQQWLGDNPPAPTVVDVTTGSGTNNVQYEFEYSSPSFREAWNANLSRDGSGRPTIVREDTLRGFVVAPASGTGTLVPFVFGHGFGQSADGLLPLVGALDLTEGPYALAALDWELHGIRGRGASDFIDLISPDTLEALAAVFHQSAVDEVVFAAAVRALNDSTELGGRIDQGGHLYAGVSMGAVFGTVVTAIDERIRASVLNVGGGGVINIVRFSSLFADLGVRDIFVDLVSVPGASSTGLPPDLDAEILLVMAQFAIDDADGINYGRHLVSDRFAHMPAQAPPILLQESIGDGIVPNFTTESLARAASLALVEPGVVPVPGLETATAPTMGDPAHGLTQFRVFSEGIAAHVALVHGAVQRQLMDLFASVMDGDPDTDGNITYSCDTVDGSCDTLP